VVGGPRIVPVSRPRLVRNALRFAFLGTMLLYAFAPPMAGAEDLLGLRALRPGPWAGAAAGFACVLAGVFYSAGPAWRSTLQPPRGLVDVHFYATALGAMTVFAALMLSSGAAAAGDDPAARLRPYARLATGGGVLMLVSVGLFALNVTLAIRAHRSVRSSAT
jgi:hypothetical protein